MKAISREGYGNAFNDIFVHDTILKKNAKNKYGLEKLRNETNFYKTCIEVCSNFPIPTVYEMLDNEIIMKYYSDSQPLSLYYWSFTSEAKKRCLEKIQEALTLLHNSRKKEVTFDQLKTDIFEETQAKIFRRYKEVESIINSYSIYSVNGLKLVSFFTLMTFIKEQADLYIKDMPREYNIIHGDCQFNNILWFEKDESFLFIDPRGYFGTSEIFGLADYDAAKILFALTGYDVFDRMIVDTLHIENGNLILPAIPLEKDILTPVTFRHILMLSMWLGNAHCFLSQPNKAICSHYYARYLGTLIYTSVRSFTK